MSAHKAGRGHKSHRKVIVMAGSRAEANATGASRGYTPSEVLWPRAVSDLTGYAALPVIVATRFWDNRNADELADYFAARVTAAERERANESRLARAASSPLN